MTSKVRQATAEDVKRFYADDPMYYSARAVVVEHDGDIVGIGGVCRVGNQIVIFSDIIPERVTKKDLVIASRMVLEIAKRYRVVIAYADKTVPTAESFAAHFGFVKTGASTPEGDVMMKENKPWNR